MWLIMGQAVNLHGQLQVIQFITALWEISLHDIEMTCQLPLQTAYM